MKKLLSTIGVLTMLFGAPAAAFASDPNGRCCDREGCCEDCDHGCCDAEGGCDGECDGDCCVEGCECDCCHHGDDEHEAAKGMEPHGTEHAAHH